MNWLTLNQIKKHLNIDDYFHDDDAYLTDLGAIAEKAVEKHIDYPLSEIIDSSTADSSVGNTAHPIIQAMLLLIGNWYMNRESVSFAAAVPVPHAFDYLIALYQNYDHISKFESLQQ